MKAMRRARSSIEVLSEDRRPARWFSPDAGRHRASDRIEHGLTRREESEAIRPAVIVEPAVPYLKTIGRVVGGRAPRSSSPFSLMRSAPLSG